jgi:hypothetical protein
LSSREEAAAACLGEVAAARVVIVKEQSTHNCLPQLRWALAEQLARTVLTPYFLLLLPQVVARAVMARLTVLMAAPAVAQVVMNQDCSVLAAQAIHLQYHHHRVTAGVALAQVFGYPPQVVVAQAKADLTVAEVQTPEVTAVQALHRRLQGLRLHAQVVVADKTLAVVGVPAVQVVVAVAVRAEPRL